MRKKIQTTLFALTVAFGFVWIMAEGRTSGFSVVDGVGRDERLTEFHFNVVNNEKGSAVGTFEYGAVTKVIKSLAVSGDRKYATIYFDDNTFVTVVDGHNNETSPDMISGMHTVVDEQPLLDVIKIEPSLMHRVTDGKIEIDIFSLLLG